MHISASSGLHCPLLTNSSCGTRNAAGSRCPGGGNILSSPQPGGSPQAEPAGGAALGRAPSPSFPRAIFSVEGQLPAQRSLCWPCSPQQNTCSDTGGSQCSANRAKVLFPRISLVNVMPLPALGHSSSPCWHHEGMCPGQS